MLPDNEQQQQQKASRFPSDLQGSNLTDLGNSFLCLPISSFVLAKNFILLSFFFSPHLFLFIGD